MQIRSSRHPGESGGPARALGPVLAVGIVLLVVLVALAAAAWTSSPWILLPASLVVACLGLFAFLGYRTERDLDEACDEIEHDRNGR